MSFDIKGRDTCSRREFFGKSALVLAAAGGIRLGYGFDKNAAQRLTFIAYNVYKCNGWPREGKRATKAREQNQIVGRLAQELALYDPDVINFSESPDEGQVKEIATRLNMKYVFFESGGNWPGTLLTRLAIEKSENVPMQGERPSDLFTRHWGRAILKLSNGRRVSVHSAHLFPHDTPEAGAIRKREIAEILRAAQSDLANVDSVVVMGDLNHTPAMPEYKQWMDAGYTDTFAKAGKGTGATIKADHPGQRIDYILVRGSLSNAIAESRPLFEGEFRTNPADPESFALSDHLPQLTAFNIS